MNKLTQILATIGYAWLMVEEVRQVIMYIIFIIENKFYMIVQFVAMYIRSYKYILNAAYYKLILAKWTDEISV